jgi:methylated-DNA-[protein]-cysteine S-methyltransferase
MGTQYSSKKKSPAISPAATLVRSQINTPAGVFHIIADHNILLAGGFQKHAGLLHYLDDKYENAKFSDAKKIAGISEHIAAWADGELRAINKIKTSQPGGEFYQAVWKAMRKISPGKVFTYSELAAHAGNPKAVRAAGSACARNAVALVVPCHRVVKTGGALGNYAYGVSYKVSLLEHEGYLEKA